MERWLESFAHANFVRSGDTAHDLKTPLNVAVLNLELLRMRLLKVAGDDEKVMNYAAAVELELRRMAIIFDAFFILSTPPKNDEQPQIIDAAPLCAEAAAKAGLAVRELTPALVCAHEARIRTALNMFFEGSARLLKPEGRRASAHPGGGLVITVAGTPEQADFEVTKIFKFYYTDALGNPDLSLATARLIAETYGGQLEATQESDKVALRLSLPPGEE